MNINIVNNNFKYRKEINEHLYNHNKNKELNVKNKKNENISFQEILNEHINKLK